MVEQTKIALNGGIPQKFTEWFFNDKLLKKMNKEYQEIFWKGDKAHAGSAKAYLKVTDGIEKQLANAAGVSKLTATAFTVNNIVAQVESAVMDAITNANTNETDTEGYKIFMNYADVRLLRVALGKLVNGNTVDAIFKNYAQEGENSLSWVMRLFQQCSLQAQLS